MGLRRPTIQFFCFAHHPMRCRTPEGCTICNQSEPPHLVRPLGRNNRMGAATSESGTNRTSRPRAAVNDHEQVFNLNRRSLHSFPKQTPKCLASVSNGETEMTRFKVLSAGLIAAAMLTTPVMAREYRHVAKRSDVSAPRGALDGRDCVRAPDVGAFASDPYTRPPCERAFN